MATFDNEQFFSDIETQDLGGFDVDTFFDTLGSEPNVAIEAPQVDPESFSSSVGRGVQGLISSAGGASEALGELTGIETITQWGQEVRNNAILEMQKYGQSGAPNFLDAETPEDYVAFTKEALGNVLPSIGVSSSAGLAGYKLGGIRGAAIGALVTSGVLGAGEIQNLIKQLNPEARNPLASLLGGAVMGSLDLIGLKSIAGPVIRRLGIDGAEDVVVKELVRKGASQKVAEDTAKAFFTEATTEAAQEAVKQSVARSATDEEQIYADQVDDLVNAFMAGGIGGAAIGAPLSIRSAAFDTTLKEPTEVVEKEIEAPTDIKRIYKAVASRPTDVLEHYKFQSPAFASILDDLRIDDRQKTGVVPDTVKDLEENYRAIGAFIDEASRGLTKKEITELGHKYAKGERSHPFQQAMAKVGGILGIKGQKLFNTEIRENWIYSMLDKNKILKNKEAFERDFAPYIDPNPVVAHKKLESFYEELNSDGDSVTAMIDNQRLFAENSKGREEYQDFIDNPTDYKYQTLVNKLKNKHGVRRNASMEASRYFPQVPQHIVEGWVAGDPKERMIAAIQKGSRRIAYAEKFGANNEKLNTRILMAIKETAQAGNPISHSDINYLYKLLDAYQGVHGQVTNNAWRQAQATLNTVGSVSMLPLATLSSFVEMFNIGIKFNTLTMLESMIPAIRTAARQLVETRFKSLPLSEMSKQMQASNITFAASQHVIAQRMTDVATTKWQASLQNKFFKFNGLAYWTHFMRIWAAHASKIAIKDDLTIVGRDPRPTTKRKADALQRLYHVGIDPVAYLNGTRKVQKEMEDTAVRRLVHDIVLEPHALVRPIWMSNGNIAVLAQLKGYPTMFTNTILPMLLDKINPNKVGGYNAVMGMVDTAFIIGGALLMGAFQDELKRAIKGQGEDDRDDVQYTIDILERTLMPIQLGYLTNMFKAATYQSDPSTTILGPSASLLNDTVRTMTKVADEGGSEALTEWLIKRTPLSPWAGVLVE